MMHQVPDDVKRQGLVKIARVLKPGGRLPVVDTRRPDDPHHGPVRPVEPKRPVCVGTWNSGVHDQAELMRAAGFSQIESRALDVGNARLPEIGFALGSIARAGAGAGDSNASL
jgi:hypothetical protein